MLNHASSGLVNQVLTERKDVNLIFKIKPSNPSQGIPSLKFQTLSPELS
jgi:hypothetical protein